MRQRNPNANCGNCPMGINGECCAHPPNADTVMLHRWDDVWDMEMRRKVLSYWPPVSKERVCGEHPNFWQDAPAETPDWLPIVAGLFKFSQRNRPYLQPYPGALQQYFDEGSTIETAVIAMLKAAGRVKE